MKFLPVESTDLKAVFYDELLNQLFIKFQRGEVIYVYFDVNKKIYDGLIEADSKGKFFHANIKKQYSYKRLTEDEIKWT